MAGSIFFLGSPGSGKSTARRFVREIIHNMGWDILTADDYEILLDMFVKEMESEQRRFATCEHGGFEILDMSAADEALMTLVEKIRNMQMQNANDLLRRVMFLIEFSRPDYLAALSMLDESFLRNAYFICIHADLSTCLQRNRARVERKEHGDDDHFVPEQIVDEYHQDMHKVAEKIKLCYQLQAEHILVIDSTEPYEHFARKIADFTRDVLEEERSHLDLKRLQMLQRKYSNHDAISVISGDTAENPCVTTEGKVPATQPTNISERDTEGIPKVASAHSPTPVEKNQLFAPMW